MSDPVVRQIVLASRPKGPPKAGELPFGGGGDAEAAARRSAAAGALSVARSLHARPHGRREILCQAGRRSAR